jgi:hypothetical protein
VIGVTPPTRAVSNAGDLVDLDVVGVEATSDGLTESLICARGG